MTITVYSAEALTEKDIQKIRYLMRKAPHKNTALGNIFPGRFRRRDNNIIYFDTGKRRYTAKFDCEE